MKKSANVCVCGGGKLCSFSFSARKSIVIKSRIMICQCYRSQVPQKYRIIFSAGQKCSFVLSVLVIFSVSYHRQAVFATHKENWKTGLFHIDVCASMRDRGGILVLANEFQQV